VDTNDVITGIIARESREYSNRAADRGGPTKFGITLAKLAEYRKRPCSSADVEGLQESEAREIYANDFVSKPGFDKIVDAALRVFVIDAAVQHGPQTAIKMIQRAVHVFPDGVFGPKTQDAVNRVTPRAGLVNMFAERLRFYGAIIAHDKEAQRAKDAGFDRLQSFNALGWANRMADLLVELAP
jgi:lysozyme family protein